MTFKEVPRAFDVPQIEHEVMEMWKEHNVLQQYLHRNDRSQERFSFLDGPITANGVMGVHHAWGRTYKDLWQRYHTMLGRKQRYQNGFDCQGLWVEVTVERELGFSSKRDIETYGVAEFVRKCKASVFHFADIITRQSQRLGQFMDWDHSYYTLSDENNYGIWHFLKKCHEQGLVYQGTDVMPWCTRCATGLSEHEIATEGYQELTHSSVYVRFPLLDEAGAALLVWTTTPWTLTSNVAVAVHPELTYLKVQQGDQTLYLAKGAIGALRGPYDVVTELSGADLLGRPYAGPFDELPAVAGAEHIVIPWEEVTESEGTGLVHIAPGCGKEDFALGKEHGLKVVAPIDQFGVYAEGFGWLSGRNVQQVADDIIEDLRQKGVLYRAQKYTHRYPVCWRCGTELVFRLVQEWFIAMGPLREPMMEVVRRIRWLPAFGLERELDWLRNMDDWMISKKRYWGLALPFWICPDGHLNVVGGRAELEQRALDSLDQLESPHRPWIDEVKIRCESCGQVATRIPDVGNAWLDAGIVSFSTMKYDTDPAYWQEWFPADFITESFPGQFRNWFYSLLAMSTVLENTNPFKTVLGHALVRDEQGREMHKSWGNAIPFDEAADRAGADIMRWLFVRHNPETNVHFGWGSLDEVKRRLLVLWNTYSFFVTYARVDRWTPDQSAADVQMRPLLDRWILARLHQCISEVRGGLDDFDAMGPALSIERLIDDLSTWYVRRSRRRFWRAENDSDKLAAYSTLYSCLTTLARLLAPFMPFMAESMYQNLVRTVVGGVPVSVHLTDYPSAEESLVDRPLLEAMAAAQKVVALGRAARDRVNVKVRQPLARLFVRTPDAVTQGAVNNLRDIILDELNVKDLQFAGAQDEFLVYSVRPNLPVLGPRLGKRLPAVRSALADLNAAEVAAAAERGESICVHTSDGDVELASTEVLVSAREREGFAAIAADGYLVALDTELTDALIREGIARQVVRQINEWRKAAGFSIEDRIRVRYESSTGVDETFEQFHDYIGQETLAVTIERRPPTGDGFSGETRFDDQWLRVELQQA